MAPGRGLSVGEIARRSGVTIATVHFYEAEGLIRSQRSPGNQRRYSRDVLRRIGVIRAAQAVGLPLADIAEALRTLPGEQSPTRKDWDLMARAWRHELQERIDRLTLLRDNLAGCIGCGCLSLKVCPLFNPGDAAASLGTGAHYLIPNATRPSRSRFPSATRSKK